MDRFSRRKVLLGSAAAAGALGWPRISVRAAPPPPESITPQLIEAARKEGKLTWYTSVDLPVAEVIAKAFEGKFAGIAVRIDFNAQPVQGHSQLAIVCADRPGLLAAVAHLFRECRIRVHDARIATFGERVEDFFLISDENDGVLGAPARVQLRAALLSLLDNTEVLRHGSA